MLVKGDKFPSTKEEFIAELIRNKDLVIVEGKKDVSKLTKFGISNVKEISRMPLYSFAEEIGRTDKSVVLLLDNDSAGRMLYSKLKREFCRLGVKVDSYYRKALAKLKISHVEGL